MGLMGLLPDWMKDGGGTQPAQGSAPAPAPAPAPIISAPGGGTMQVVSSYGAPPHDQVLTDRIIAMVTETVPAIKALLEEADKLKSIEPDFGKRLNTVMILKGFSAAQASDASIALSRALDNVQRQSESDITSARAQQVERPRQRATELAARKQQLSDEIAGIDRDINAANDSAAQAEGRIQTEQAKLQASAVQAKAWIDSLARLITRT